MFGELVEFFWRGAALERARAAEPKALQTVLDLRDASETLGFGATTTGAQRLLLGRLGRELRTLHGDDEPMLERIDKLRADLDRAARVPEVIRTFESLRGLVEDTLRRDGKQPAIAGQRFRRMTLLATAIALFLAGLFAMLGSAR
jgi:hypothetical protein